MNKQEAMKEINETQEYYVNELIKALNDKSRECFKEINFTSDTGTGKTRMIAKLCNKMPDVYFIVTTLSKGQLNHQIAEELKKFVVHNNVKVYGLQDYRINSKLTLDEILGNLPVDKKIVWLRDEGHINTNRWQEVFDAIGDKCWKIVNISATNKEEGVRCNFTHTMMLRTVHQYEGTPEDALDKLLEVKEIHSKVENYNPCAIMRALDENITERIVEACKKRKLKYINITDESYDMSDLCKDDNEYDVIINKFKIVEGIDVRRAHVLYMTNKPSNVSTTIQIIGRCRRNALLYRNDIDIFEDKTLLEETMKCYAYFNVDGTKVDSDENGNLCMAFCDKISCEKLKVGSKIHVEEGKLENGLTILELEGQTGDFEIQRDDSTGFNVVLPEGEFYKEIKKRVEPTLMGLTKEQCYERLIKQKDFCWATGENYITQIAYLSNEPYKDVPVVFEDEYDTHWGESTRKGKYVLDVYKYGRRFKYDQNRWYWDFDEENSLKLTCGQGVSHDEYIFEKESDRDEYIEKLKEKRKKLKVPQKITINTTFVMHEIYKHGRFYNLLSLSNSKEVPTENLTVRVYPASSVKYTKKQIDDYFKKNDFIAYNKIYNDKESAIIGTDLMRQIETEDEENFWIENKSVTTKVKQHCKLNTFIESRYTKQLSNVKTFNGKNKFSFDKKANSCLGYCAEYYGKYLIYGNEYLSDFIKEAMKESHCDYVNDNIVVRACILKYKEQMVRAFGNGVSKVIKTIGVQSLIQEKYKDFVEKVIELGNNIYHFVHDELGLKDVKPEYDPVLSIDHIGALADFITKDRIIDFKCTSNITKEHVKQVLGYHYLSTKRDDLDIKEVIILDAVTNKYVRIDVSN